MSFRDKLKEEFGVKPYAPFVEGIVHLTHMMILLFALLGMVVSVYDTMNAQMYPEYKNSWIGGIAACIVIITALICKIGTWEITLFMRKFFNFIYFLQLMVMGFVGTTLLADGYGNFVIVGVVFAIRWVALFCQHIRDKKRRIKECFDVSVEYEEELEAG